MDKTRFILTSDSIAVSVLVFFQIVVFIILFYSKNKGIDFTDEGLYLALAQPNQDNNFAQLNHKVLFYSIFQLTGISFGLEGLRILKFILLLISFCSFYPIFKYYKIGLFWMLFCFFGLFSHYAYYSQSLSYNTLSFVFYCFFFSLFFSYIIYKKNILFVFGIGAFSSFAFFAKSTTGLLLLSLGLLFCFFLTIKSLNKRESLLLIISFLAGFALIQVFFSLNSREYGFFETIFNGFELSSYNSSHNKFSIIKYPISAFRWMVVLIMSGYFTSLSIKSKKLSLKVIFLFLSIIFLSLFIISHDKLNLYRVFEFSFLMLSYFLIGFSSSQLIKFSLPDKLILFFLLLSPLFVSFGTNSYHFKGGVLYCFFPFLVLAILNSKEVNQTNFIKYVSLIIVSLLTFKIFLNVIHIPFKQPNLMSPLFEYTYLSEKIIYLPESYHHYLSDLSQIFRKNTLSSDKIMGLYEMPGDILLAGRTNSINPCIWEPYQFEFYMKKAESEGMLSEIKFVLSKDKFSSSDFKANEIQILDSLNHPILGKIYFSKIIR